MKTRTKWSVLIGTTSVIVVAVLVIVASGASVEQAISGANNWLLARFGWLYLLVALGMMVTCIAMYFSPLGKKRIGGDEAKSQLSKPAYYAIMLCAMMAIGMLTMGGAEILAHYSAPPAFWGVDPQSPEAAEMGLAQVFIDWTFLPYATYALPTVLFAYAFYNMRRSFTLSSLLAALTKHEFPRWACDLIDIVCAATLICGVITSLGQGAMAILGGVSDIVKVPGLDQNTPFVIVVIIAIGLVFTISAVSGVLRGIKHLSTINAYALLAVGVFVFIVGPTAFILQFATEGAGTFLDNFFTLTLNTDSVTQDQWSYTWTIFSLAVFMAWAVVSCVFLGRVSRGFTVRTVLNAAFLVPSLISGAWMAVMSGTSIYLQTHGVDMVGVFESGIPNVSIALLNQLPLAPLLIVLYVILLIVGFTTAGDSLVNGIAGLCTEGRGDDGDGVAEPSAGLKIFWGAVITAIASLCAMGLGFMELRAVSNIGAFPALVLLLLSVVAAWRLMVKPDDFDI